jgi:molybdenum cofactor biosynthesis protein B
MMKMDPKTFIASLLEWSSSITPKKSTWVVASVDHEIRIKEMVPDDTAKIVGVVLKLIGEADCDSIVTIGGTGLSKRDVTIESVQKLISKEVIGFGELFRSLSFQKIGTASMLSRALAGVAGDKIIFCLPGSPQSIELGLEELILPEIGHMLKHIRE